MQEPELGWEVSSQGQPCAGVRVFNIYLMAPKTGLTLQDPTGSKTFGIKDLPGIISTAPGSQLGS